MSTQPAQATQPTKPHAPSQAFVEGLNAAVVGGVVFTFLRWLWVSQLSGGQVTPTLTDAVVFGGWQGLGAGVLVWGNALLSRRHNPEPLAVGQRRLIQGGLLVLMAFWFAGVLYIEQLRLHRQQVHVQQQLDAQAHSP